MQNEPIPFPDLAAIFPQPTIEQGRESYGHEKPGRDGLISSNSATSRLHRHTVGAHFKPRHITTVKTKQSPWGAPISPAQYRRFHMGVKKANV